MRRRQERATVGDPGGLLRFEYAQWAAPADPPAGEWPSRALIRAYQRYSAAVRAWRAEHGVTWDEWQQWTRHGVVTG